MPKLEWEWLEDDDCFYVVVSDNISMQVNLRVSDIEMPCCVGEIGDAMTGTLCDTEKETALEAMLWCEKELKKLAFAWTSEQLKPENQPSGKVDVIEVTRGLTTNTSYQVGIGVSVRAGIVKYP